MKMIAMKNLLPLMALTLLTAPALAQQDPPAPTIPPPAAPTPAPTAPDAAQEPAPPEEDAPPQRPPPVGRAGLRLLLSDQR